VQHGAARAAGPVPEAGGTRLPGREAEAAEERWPRHYLARDGVQRAQEDTGASRSAGTPAGPRPLHPLPRAPTPVLRAAASHAPALGLPRCRPRAQVSAQQLPPAERSRPGARGLSGSRGKGQAPRKGATVLRVKRNRSSPADHDPPWKGDIGSRRTSVLCLRVPFPGSIPCPAPGTSYRSCCQPVLTSAAFGRGQTSAWLGPPERSGRAPGTRARGL